jgi:hypothetical protein
LAFSFFSFRRHCTKAPYRSSISHGVGLTVNFYIQDSKRDDQLRIANWTVIRDEMTTCHMSLLGFDFQSL